MWEWIGIIVLGSCAISGLFMLFVFVCDEQSIGILALAFIFIAIPTVIVLKCVGIISFDWQYIIIPLLIVVGIVVGSASILFLGAILLVFFSGSVFLIIIFFTEKNPIKWLALPLWSVGTWLAWEYMPTHTELVCPPDVGSCNYDQMVNIQYTFWELIMYTWMASVVVGGICVAIFLFCSEKLKKHYMKNL